MAIASRNRLLIAACALAVVVTALVWREAASKSANDPIGLFTSLPILWNESGDLGDMLSKDAPVHWAKIAIEEHGPIVALDQLAATGPGSLHGIKRLIIAQPRPLSPQENVALDQWVRGGGQLLLFADPALTEDTNFPVGDKRRPQDIVMLSPILTHWGLRLEFDDEDEFIEGPVFSMGLQVPVNMPGRLVASDPRNCSVWETGLIATCKIGQGRILAVADAAVLERAGAWDQGPKPLHQLLDAAFAAR